MTGRDATLDVDCPTCKAPASVPCFTSGGRPASGSHVARQDLWGERLAERIYGPSGNP